MKIIKKNKTYFLNFNNDKEAEELNNYTNKELEIKIINTNTIAFSVSEKTPNLERVVPLPKPVISKDLIKKKIIDILLDKDLSFKDKVEGNFENLLKKEDLEIFKEMLKEKEIITFRQSDKYKKAIYVVNEKLELNKEPLNKITEKPKEPQKPETSKTTDENSDQIIKDFIKKKYVIIKTQQTADKFSKEFYVKFKNNEIKGQKSFDGYFYVIDMNVYNQAIDLLLSSGFTKSFSIEELSEKTGKEIELLRVVIEFLKEEGLIIEKKKNTFYLV